MNKKGMNKKGRNKVKEIEENRMVTNILYTFSFCSKVGLFATLQPIPGKHIRMFESFHESAISISKLPNRFEIGIETAYF